METGSSRVLEFRIPADTRYVAVVRRGVRNLAESVGFTGEAITDMEVAVSEAVTNSVEHGSPDAGFSAVVVKCCASLDSMVVEVEDQGCASGVPLNPATMDRVSEHGRGVTMMRELMDSCEGFRTEHGIRVRMEKQRSGC